MFKEFKAPVKKQTGKHIKVLQSDCGGEYISVEFAEFFKENDIVSQLTSLATH
jgi:hypothetical protein